MLIDRDTAIGLRWPQQRFQWSPTDVSGYHRAVCRFDAGDAVLPTFAMTAPGVFGVASPDFLRPQPPEICFPGIQLNRGNLLHEEQEVVVHRPIPAQGRSQSCGEVVDIEDRAGAAVLVQRAVLVDSNGAPLISATSRIHARVEGTPVGANAYAAHPVPPCEPTAVADIQTVSDQAIEYHKYIHGSRMTNNVHTDRAFAEAAGFPRTILQGVCTYGIVCGALVRTLLADDPTRVHRYSARFLRVVFPGDLLRTRMWADGSRCVFVTSVPERGDVPVLSGTLDTETSST
ncbi:MaoC/PaaZ C-terminal domain-containing protein [Mycobacterium camsae]|uniref:MaoC/PaaZ C-terminal domain-containing protein n=1 Tax=Mycobacterium gordonae TaxID=1778 RepID=UPI00197E0259|nr:MaoC/PaaZ C-terminal domain-containing protein [Mycobacterium gordonae]